MRTSNSSTGLSARSLQTSDGAHPLDSRARLGRTGELWWGFPLTQEFPDSLSPASLLRFHHLQAFRFLNALRHAGFHFVPNVHDGCSWVGGFLLDAYDPVLGGYPRCFCFRSAAQPNDQTAFYNKDTPRSKRLCREERCLQNDKQAAGNDIDRSTDSCDAEEWTRAEDLASTGPCNYLDAVMTLVRTFQVDRALLSHDRQGLTILHYIATSSSDTPPEVVRYLLLWIRLVWNRSTVAHRIIEEDPTDSTSDWRFYEPLLTLQAVSTHLSISASMDGLTPIGTAVQARNLPALRGFIEVFRASPFGVGDSSKSESPFNMALRECWTEGLVEMLTAYEHVVRVRIASIASGHVFALRQDNLKGLPGTRRRDGSASPSSREDAKVTDDCEGDDELSVLGLGQCSTLPGRLCRSPHAEVLYFLDVRGTNGSTPFHSVCSSKLSDDVALSIIHLLHRSRISHILCRDSMGGTALTSSIVSNRSSAFISSLLQFFRNSAPGVTPSVSAVIRGSTAYLPVFCRSQPSGSEKVLTTNAAPAAASVGLSSAIPGTDTFGVASWRALRVSECLVAIPDVAYGRTALHFAAATGALDAFQLLSQEWPAGTRLPDRWGKTPAELLQEL